MLRIPEAWYPRRTTLGLSVTSPSYKVTCSVPLIVGGSPWLNGVWSNIPLKVPVPPEGMVVPSTLPPRTLISATTSARVPSVFHRTAPPVKEPKIVPRSPIVVCTVIEPPSLPMHVALLRRPPEQALVCSRFCGSTSLQTAVEEASDP